MAEIIGMYVVPLIFLIVAAALLFSQKDLFFEFIAGAKDGAQTCFAMLPTLVILMTAVKMFSSVGAMRAMTDIADNVFSKIGFPKELFPLAITRPISGSAATATVNELFAKVGADSFEGRCASIIMGASDTIVYTLTVYFGSVGVKKTRHAYPAAFLTMIFCILFSVLLTKVFF